MTATRVETLEEALRLKDAGGVTSWVLTPEAYYAIALKDGSRQHLRSLPAQTFLGFPYVVKNA